MGILDAPARIPTIANLPRTLAAGGKSMSGTLATQSQSNAVQSFTGAANSHTGQKAAIAPHDLFSVAPIWGAWQRATTAAVFWGEMPIYTPVKFKASLVRLSGPLGVEVIPFTFGGRPFGVTDGQAPIQADPLSVFIPKGELYFIRTTPFTSLTGVSGMTAPSCAVVASGGSINTGTYNVAYVYVYADGTESLASLPTAVTITANGSSITVTAIANPNNGATGYRIYFSPASGTNLLYQDPSGVQPFGGTNPTLTFQPVTAGASSSLGTRTINTSLTSYQYPATQQLAGGTYLTTAGGRSTGEWQSLSKDLNYPSYTQGGSNAGNSFAPYAIESATAQVMASLALLGDSRLNGVGDLAYDAGGGGGYGVRAALQQTARVPLDVSVTPFCGITSLASSGEQALQFANPIYSFKRRQLAKKHTHFLCNYSINDIDQTITLGSATLMSNVVNIMKDLLGVQASGPRKTLIQATIEPFTISSDGFRTIANQSLNSDAVTHVAYAEGYRRQHNNNLLNAGGALTITSETPFAAKTGTNTTPVTPSTNLYAGGDGATTTFMAAYSVLVGSETVKVNGVTKVAGTDYTYTDNVAINGSNYASGITFGAAPANGATVTISYTSIPGFRTLIAAVTGNSNVYIFNTCGAIEVNAAGVATTNGGWWKPWSSTDLTTTAVTSGSSATAVFPASTFTVDQYAGKSIVNGSRTGYGAVTKNDATTLTVGNNWATPTAGDTIYLGTGYTVDGTHPSPYGHLLIAQAFNYAWMALPA